MLYKFLYFPLASERLHVAVDNKRLNSFCVIAWGFPCRTLKPKVPTPMYIHTQQYKCDEQFYRITHVHSCTHIQVTYCLVINQHSIMTYFHAWKHTGQLISARNDRSKNSRKFVLLEIGLMLISLKTDISTTLWPTFAF